MKQGGKQDFSDRALGINVGSTSVKMCLLVGEAEEWAQAEPHDGDVPGTVARMLSSKGIMAGLSALVTGHEGRKQFHVKGVIEPVAIEKAVNVMKLDVRAVVSVGGEDMVVYSLDARRRIVKTHSGNKCASGTGEFFSQQLKRMNLELEAVGLDEVAGSAVCRLSSRCSVFMKSDCTHKLNKGEAGKYDIVLSLSNVMAKKIQEFLVKAKIEKGRVLLAGGCTRNPHLMRFIREGLPQVEFLVLPQSAHLEAFGAAHLARLSGSPLPPPEKLFVGGHTSHARAEAFAGAKNLVTFVPSQRGPLRAGASYVLGVDGGSTTTKVALVDMETKKIAASHYGRTLGDPVAALKDCLREVQKQIASSLGPQAEIKIPLVAVTGSSRELLGVYCGTRGVYNEILAHTTGTSFFDPRIDTIFEIGGQDAKYVTLRNRVPVDYAMNEACSAGTGSFLEEAAAGDLDIHRPEDIGPMALQAKAPLKFGEHCSAFINSDIRKAIQQGATRPDIVAGLVLSIVSNYLNRVVGNRRIGGHIVLQGGVAKNAAVPLAFASLLKKPVTVPPDPELMGSFGVALLALSKNAEGLLERGDFTLSELASREIVYEREYTCGTCDNYCPIKILKVGEKRYHFGGRCNKYANMRKKVEIDEASTKDWVELRHRLLYEKYAPAKESFTPQSDRIVAIPEAFSVHSLWPLYANFFHELGVETRLITKVSEKDMARCESSFCYPAEVAHGLMGAMLESGADFYFLPHFKRMPSLETDVHAVLCPLTQGMPYYLRTAFDLPEGKLLRPVLDFEHGLGAAGGVMEEVALKIGRPAAAGRRAWRLAVAKQEACQREMMEIGRTVLEAASRERKPVIVLFGRPYNALTSSLNLSVPRKFVTRGYSVLPFDFLPAGGREIFPNMYWHFGQVNMKATVMVKEHPELFPCFITNFSCAPDSFILHYLRWVYNTKPFLVLEMDSHSADAGIDTRVEAFLDIVEGYRRLKPDEAPMMAERDWNLKMEGGKAELIQRHTGEKRLLTHPQVTVLWPSMGKVAGLMIDAIAKSYGIQSEVLRPADLDTITRARAVASGKECIPALMVLGSFLEYFATHSIDPERVYLLFMPSTTGPCRTGQYGIFYQNLFQELGYRNVVILSPSSDNSYTELGADFSKRTWLAVVLSDAMMDIEYALKSLAQDVPSALKVFDEVLVEMVAAAREGSPQVVKGMEAWSRRLAAIPLKRPLKEARKVLIVGEIFVRRDDYSVGPLMRQMAEKEIVGKITGLGEWIHYLDFDRNFRLKKQLAYLPWWQRPFSKIMGQLLYLKLERAWKHWQEERLMEPLRKSGLVPEVPHDMEKIMARADRFATPEFDTEATLSPCVASLAMEEGYQGVAVIAPFACLPGRLIESIYAPYARARNWPVICLENDGNAYPPHVLSRIEVFAHNVERGNGEEPETKKEEVKA